MIEFKAFVPNNAIAQTTHGNMRAKIDFFDDADGFMSATAYGTMKGKTVTVRIYDEGEEPK